MNYLDFPVVIRQWYHHNLFLKNLFIMSPNYRMPKEEIINFISSCQDSESGGISVSNGHDPHMLYTLSAIQVNIFYKYYYFECLKKPLLLFIVPIQILQKD